jgi:hypothetical protein
MSYVNSTNILSVFPCVSRGADYDSGSKSKLMSEKNITNIVKSITDKESYIISWNADNLKCVVQGYYFEIKVSTSPNGSQYLHLQMNDDILHGDNGGSFMGVEINDNPKGADLVLCVNGKIPNSSREKFSANSVSDLTKIDCGELN